MKKDLEGTFLIFDQLGDPRQQYAFFLERERKGIKNK
jgi:hypothetical protein